MSVPLLSESRIVSECVPCAVTLMPAKISGQMPPGFAAATLTSARVHAAAVPPLIDANTLPTAIFKVPVGKAAVLFEKYATVKIFPPPTARFQVVVTAIGAEAVAFLESVVLKMMLLGDAATVSELPTANDIVTAAALLVVCAFD